MNIIRINQPEYELLVKWSVEFKRLLKVCADFNKYYFQKCKLYLGEIFAYFELKTDYIKMTLHNPDGAMMAKTHIRYTPNGENDYQIKVIEGSRELIGTIKTAVNAYININAFIYYANITEGREVVLLAHTDNNNKVFVLRKFEEKLYCVQTTCHRSPEGIFSVRGHFRRYQSGKIIWIDEYLKGKDE